MKDIPALLQKKELDFENFQSKNLSVSPEARKLFYAMINQLSDGKYIIHPDVTSPKERTKEFIANKPESTRKQQFKRYLGL